MMDWIRSAKGRAWLYTVALAVIALLVGYQVLGEAQAPLWVALVTALLAVAPATALGHITPDPEGDDSDGQAN
jgi:hypothetical protein